MSEENVEVVREAWKAFNDGGIDPRLDYYAEDCVIEDFPELPDHATYEGKAGLRRRNRQFTESWENLTFQPLEFIDAGDEVLAVVAMRGHGKGSDTPMDAVISFVYEVRNGMIVRDRAFTSKSQALEAAGLRE
jgi:ketosteroid isomerase-like protein